VKDQHRGRGIIPNEDRLEICRSGLYVHRPVPGKLLKVVIPAFRPVLYIPPGTGIPAKKPPSLPQPGPMQVRHTVSVLDSAALKEGVPREVERFGDEDCFTPPWAEEGINLVCAFQGHLVNDDAIHDALLRLVDLYPHRANRDEDFDLISHILSWDYWESTRDSVPPSEISGVRVYSIPHRYGEGIYHLCAGERLGNMWSRLLHTLVMTYILGLHDPDGPTFEPCVFPNLYVAQEGTLAGYHKIYQLRLVGPGGDLVLISPGESRRQALSRLGPGEVRKDVGDHWDELKPIVDRASGYRRRRKLSEEVDVPHVKWLFQRHVMQETEEEIASRFGVAPSTVKSAVKDLRSLLDLRARSAVHCFDHRLRPPRLHAHNK